MDKRTLLAVILSVLILITYQELISFLYPPPPPKPVPSQPLKSAEPVPTPAAKNEEEKSEPLAEAPATAVQTQETSAERDISVENEVYTATLTSRGGRLKSLRLKHYPGDEGKESAPLEMVHKGIFGKWPLEVQLEGKEVSVSDDAVVYEVNGKDLQLQGNEHASLTFTGKTPNGISITKIFSFTGQTYGITIEVKITGAPENISGLSLVWIEGRGQLKHSSYYVQGPAALIERKFIQEAPPQTEKLFGPGRIRWAGYVNNYFLAALLPPEGEQYRLVFSSVDGTVTTKLTQPWEKNPVSYTVYVGPKEFQALNAVHPSLDRAIDFGWCHVVARPLVSLLQLSHWLTGN
jgi:YidC/Oxa1 family membrane protein insertase